MGEYSRSHYITAPPCLPARRPSSPRLSALSKKESPPALPELLAFCTSFSLLESIESLIDFPWTFPRFDASPITLQRFRSTSHQ